MNRMKWILAVLVIVSLLLGSLSSVIPAPVASAQEPDEPLEMAIILKNLINPYFVAMAEGAEAAAKDLNVNMSVLAPEQPDNVEEQTNMVENLMQAGIDAIILVPADSKAIVPAVDKAREAGVPIIAADTKVIGTEVETFVGYDSRELAAIMGRWLKQYIDDNMGGTAKIVILEGKPGASTAKDRLDGFHDALDNVEGIEIAASQTAQWNRVEAVKVTEDMLTRFPDLNVIIGSNDEMALGAVEAIEARGLTPGKDVIVIGVNGAENALEAIEQGNLLATIYPNQYCLSYLAVKTAADLVRDGVQPEKEIIGELSQVIDANNVAEFKAAYAAGLKCN
jgi:ribose transport system substrate-binding protein